MRKGLRILVILGALGALAACSSLPRTRDPGYHHVQVGDTLYSISFTYGLDWRDIAAWNNIGPPYSIYFGQRLSLIPPGEQAYQPKPYFAKPVEEKSVGAWTAAQRPVSSRPASPPPVSRSEPRAPPPTAVPASSRPAATVSTAPVRNPPPTAASNGIIRWTWPTQGKMVTRFSPKTGKKGVDIGGQVGQDILAAADGEVVYSGKGLIGYGNLVIIKHNDTWLSAYGHNRLLAVKEGQRVRAGQKIAEMGQNGKSGSILHFEIRKNGQPVDPARYLPTN